MTKNAPVRLTLFLSMVLLAGCITNPASKTDLTLMPMYGTPEIPRSQELKAVDDAFVQRVEKDLGDRERASRLWVDQGFRFYNENNLDMAMRRFNQAWLLNPKEAQVFWGFSSIMHDRGEIFKAREMIQVGLDLGLGKQDPSALADAGRIYALCAASTEDKSKKAELIKQSYNLYVDASLAAPDMAYIYSSWATASYWLGNYQNAWNMVFKAEELGGSPGERFLKLLTAKMARPSH